jgi:DUF4097 and DUF4098 domain-containing protein YvlB
MIKRLALTAALIAMLVTLPAGADDNTWMDDDRYVKNEQRISEDLSGIDTLVVNNVNGSIKARLHSSNSLELTVEERVKIQKDIDADALINEVEVVAERRGNELHVFLDYGAFERNKHRHYYQSNYALKAPERLNVRFESTNGAITAPAFDGRVNLETTNGAITSEGAGQGAELDTTNGSITVNSVKGSVVADTTNGSITIEGAAGDVRADTTNGSITVTLKEVLSGNVTCDTTNGKIVFSVPAGSSYELLADTSMGKVKGGSELRYNKRRNTASGSVGGGKYKVTLETTNGSIYIK